MDYFVSSIISFLIKGILIFFAIIIGMALLSEHADKRRIKNKKERLIQQAKQEMKEKEAKLAEYEERQKAWHNKCKKEYEETKEKWKSHPLYSDVLSFADQTIAQKSCEPKFFLEIECLADGVYFWPRVVQMTYASKGYEPLPLYMYVPLTMAIGEALEEKYKDHPDISIRTLLNFEGIHSAKIYCSPKAPNSPTPPPLKKVELS